MSTKNIAELEALANNGDVGAVYELGQRYYYGVGVATDYQKARIIEKEKQDREEWERQKREKYNPDNIFNNRENDEYTKESSSIGTQIVEYKEPVFKRIINKILKFLHIK